MSRPGVATTMSMPLLRASLVAASAHRRRSRVTRSCTGAPYVASARCTWTASSRVGTSTRPRGDASGRRRCARTRRSIIGRPNAAVLPVPVCARASRSAPLETRGIDADLDRRGLLVAQAREGRTKRGRRARGSKTALSSAPEGPGAVSMRSRREKWTHVRRRRAGAPERRLRADFGS